MSKVVKIFLNKGFTPINKKIFKLETCIDFDCYIQRFNGYAIIINAGTLLDEKLHQKLTSDNLQVYVKNEDYQNYKKYTLVNKIEVELTQEGTLESNIENSISINNILEKETDASEKLKTIYYHCTNLLISWLSFKDKPPLPVKAIETLVDNLVEVIKDDEVTLSKIKDFINNEYSLATHMVNVSFFSALIANKLGLYLQDRKKLVLCSICHDIGKSYLHNKILDKPDFLTKREYDLVKEHSYNSTRLLSQNGIKDKTVINGILHHHEKLDGTGYPNGLTKNEISEFGQIIAVCDIFDALITVKPYRGAYSTYNALKLMGKEYKNKLNMKYVNIFIQLLR